MTNRPVIIFDYYGVLVINKYDERLAELRNNSPENADEFSAVNRAGDMGIMSFERARGKMAELLGLTLEELLREYARTEIVNASLINYIETELKPHYKLGLLSNSTGREQLDALFPGGGLDRIFDEVVSSGDVGAVKPDPRIYEYAAAKLGVSPEDCIMVDDIDRFCEGARDVGMKAVQFGSTEQGIADLQKLLVQVASPLDATLETL